MITQEQAERALDYIRDNSPGYAKAKADRIYIEQYRKSKKALLVIECIESKEKSTGVERESFAYAHPEYIELLKGLKVAVEKEEEIKWRMEAAKAKIEVWRSLNANNRVGP